MSADTSSNPNADTKSFNDEFLAFKNAHLLTLYGREQQRFRWRLPRHTRQWHEILARLIERNQVLDRQVAEGVKVDHASLSFAATNVFVEKAQVILEEEIRSLRRWARFFAILSAVSILVTLTLFVGADHLFTSLSISRAIENVGTNKYAFAVWFVRATAIGGLVGTLVWFFVFLTRAFFDESTILARRLHAVRFGRLLMYLKLADLENPRALEKAKEHLTLSDLEKSFGWNIETETAFRQMKIPASLAKVIVKEFAGVIAATVGRRGLHQHDEDKEEPGRSNRG